MAKKRSAPKPIVLDVNAPKMKQLDSYLGIGQKAITVKGLVEVMDGQLVLNEIEVGGMWVAINRYSQPLRRRRR